MGFQPGGRVGRDDRAASEGPWHEVSKEGPVVSTHLDCGWRRGRASAQKDQDTRGKVLGPQQPRSACDHGPSWSTCWGALSAGPGWRPLAVVHRRGWGREGWVGGSAEVCRVAGDSVQNTHPGAPGSQGLGSPGSSSAPCAVASWRE